MGTLALSFSKKVAFRLFSTLPPQGEQEFRLDPMLEDHDANMEKMNTWNFQIFDLVDITGGRTGKILSHVSHYQCCSCSWAGSASALDRTLF